MLFSLASLASLAALLVTGFFSGLACCSVWFALCKQKSGHATDMVELDWSGSKAKRASLERAFRGSDSFPKGKGGGLN